VEGLGPAPLDLAEARRLAESHRRHVRALGIAVLLLGVAGSGLIAGGLMVYGWPLVVGALTAAVVASRALAGHRRTLTRLVAQGDAFAVDAVRSHAVRLERRRRRLAGGLRYALRSCSSPMADMAMVRPERVAPLAVRLELLADALADPDVTIEPVSVALCARLLNEPMHSPLYNDRLPAAQLERVLARIERGDMLDLMRTFGAIGVRVSVIPAMLQVVGSAVEFDDVHGVAVLGVRSFSLSRSSRMVKRAFDIIGASVALALLSPLILATGLLVRLSSTGPVFFRQERVGRGGRPFKLFKFRSMVPDAEDRKAELEAHNQAAEGFFKIADDPRITPLGGFLRRTNLDELPQLLNVLRGEMSLVGPRPLIPKEDQRVVGWHRRRLELTPGMTGHWQVLGSSRVPLDEMVAIDYLYVANWSLWADLKLLLRTIPYVLSRRGL
jgi:lipopolysaccharide/colanic/teichoic acid biosynthesis glycosyltransferase